jgi:hypothetical protein
VQAALAPSVELTGVTMSIHGKKPDGGGGGGGSGETSCANDGGAKSARTASGLFGGFSEAISRCVHASHEATSSVKRNGTTGFMPFLDDQ